jgi:hypothetical protein
MNRILTIGLPLISLVALAATPVEAEQGGKWRGRAVLVVTSEKGVEVADKPDHKVWVTEYDGVVFTEVGGDFLNNARYQVVDLTDAGGDMVNGGYKTFTMPDDSKITASYTLREGNPPVFKGEWKFLSGTGRYQGISGSGTYVVHQVGSTALWDILEGEYKLP